MRYIELFPQPRVPVIHYCDNESLLSMRTEKLVHPRDETRCLVDPRC